MATTGMAIWRQDAQQLIMFEDNQNCIALAKDFLKRNPRTKHIDVKYNCF